MTTTQQTALSTAFFYLLFNVVFAFAFATGEELMAPFLEASRAASVQVLLLLLSVFVGWSFVRGDKA